MESIGILESGSIARGIEAADAALKAAEVTLLYAKMVCPGKYTILFYGDVAAVQSSVDTGAAVLEEFLIDSVVIARVHPQVIRALQLTSEPGQLNAVGVMEFYSITAAIYAADAAAKAAEVPLMAIRLAIGIGGKSVVILTGDVSAVSESVESGMELGSRKGLAFGSTVIPSPRREIFEELI